MCPSAGTMMFRMSADVMPAGRRDDVEDEC